MLQRRSFIAWVASLPILGPLLTVPNPNYKPSIKDDPPFSFQRLREHALAYGEVSYQHEAFNQICSCEASGYITQPSGARYSYELGLRWDRGLLIWRHWSVTYVGDE